MYSASILVHALTGAQASFTTVTHSIWTPWKLGAAVEQARLMLEQCLRYLQYHSETLSGVRMVSEMCFFAPASNFSLLWVPGVGSIDWSSNHG